MENQKLNKSNNHSLDCSISETKLSNKDVVEIGKALGVCVLVQKTYGKQASDLDKIARIFAHLFKNYEINDILKAIKKWVFTSSDFPTPRDILKILEGKRELDANIYQSAKKIAYDTEGRYSKSYDRDEARAYCRYYEQEKIGLKLT